MTPEEKTKKISKIIKTANKSQNFEIVDKELEQQLERLKNAKTICSFDIEFSDRFGETIVEVGASIYDRETKETYSEHFIIEEQVGKYKRNNTPMEHTLMFAHGETKKTTLTSAMKSLDRFMQNSDVNILFAQENKYSNLLKHNFKNPEFISLQDLMRLNSRYNQKLSLAQAVEEFGKLEQPINNAGNDAAVTLEILSNVFGEQISFENYNSPIVKDYSEHPQKMSASNIRQSRISNNRPFKNDQYTEEEIKATKTIKLK